MSLHDRAEYEAFVATLPAATLNEQWDALTAKVGGKVFCLLADANGDLVFKVSELAFDGLVEIDGIDQAAYFAKRQWVRVSPGALDEALLRGYVGRSHEIIATKLTRKLRAELGLSA